jgi:hypothetical protein
MQQNAAEGATMRSMFYIILASTAMAVTPSVAAAQNPHERSGFWFNGGLGYGSLGCNDCDGREGSLTGALALGGTISNRILLGVSSNGWTKDESGVAITAGTLTAFMRFYPSHSGGFFLAAGLGVGTIDVSIDGFGSDSESGAGAVLGLGYDIRVSRNISLTPFWNGVGISTSNSDANFGQIGLSITVH